MNLIDLVPIALAALLLFSARPVRPLSGFDEDYVSLRTTGSYRGLFALLVVLHHLSQRLEAGVLFPVFSQMGHLAVAFFFFLSGYGLQKSYIRKGEDYRRGFLQRRLPGLLIPYAIYTLVYCVVNNLAGNHYTLHTVLKGLYDGRPVVSNSWYVLNILYFYLFFWLLMRLCKKRYAWMVAGSLAWYAAYVLFCVGMQYGDWWYNTTHLLIFGMVWATWEAEILAFVRRRYALVTSLVWGCFAALFVLRDRLVELLPTRFAPTLLTLVTTVVFVCGVLLFSMKVRLDSPVFRFLGRYSLDIYLIQGLFLWFVRIDESILRCLAILAGVIASGVALHWVGDQAVRLYRKLTAPRAA